MIHIQKNVSLKQMTTFQLDCTVTYYAEIFNEGDIVDALDFAKKNNLPLYTIGGGSNILFSQKKLEALVLKICITTISRKTSVDNTTELVTVGAGVEWDSFVSQMVQIDLSGLEALSFIPGTVGATPVQNVGAYGTEVGELIESVYVYNREIQNYEILKNSDCFFSYRESIFKKKPDTYIITHVTFRLTKSNVGNIPEYPGVLHYFACNQKKASISEIRKTIIEIRSNKLPHPKIISSCGSFFKNPLIDKRKADIILQKYPNAVLYKITEETYKIGAGWIIDEIGLKGRNFGAISVYNQNALVLINTSNQATYSELLEVVQYIQKKVFEVFEIHLEIEPVVI